MNEKRHTDYSTKMSDLDFSYDHHFYPLDEDLPDPQVDPIIPGAKVAINKVGIGPVDLPIRVLRRNGQTQTLQAKASMYCSVDDPNAKGLNLSRVYLLMHDKCADHLTMEGIKGTLEEMATKQGSDNAYIKLRFRYPWTQEALRTRKPIVPGVETETLSNGEVISTDKMEGHIAYETTIEGRWHRHSDGSNEFKFFLTVDYVYSSTCPCSFELARNATEKRDAAANAHSQRSVMKTTVQFDPDDLVYIEDLVDLHREHIPTEVQIVVKRRDEQAFAEINGSNLLFSEDAVRLMYAALDKWYEGGKISDFVIATSHQESLHPWNAIAVIYKGIYNGLR